MRCHEICDVRLPVPNCDEAFTDPKCTDPTTAWGWQPAGFIFNGNLSRRRLIARPWEEKAAAWPGYYYAEPPHYLHFVGEGHPANLPTGCRASCKTRRGVGLVVAREEVVLKVVQVATSALCGSNACIKPRRLYKHRTNASAT